MSGRQICHVVCCTCIDLHEGRLVVVIFVWPLFGSQWELVCVIGCFYSLQLAGMTLMMRGYLVVGVGIVGLRWIWYCRCCLVCVMLLFF